MFVSYLHAHSDPNETLVERQVLGLPQILDRPSKITLKVDSRNFLTQATYVPMQPQTRAPI